MSTVVEPNCIESYKDLLTSAGIIAAFLFFLYKIFTGWLFINLNVKVEHSRQHLDSAIDHLALKLTLSKGSVDSLWLKDIQIRLSEVTGDQTLITLTSTQIIRPIGIKKRKPVYSSKSGVSIANYWTGKVTKRYIISLNEEVVFSAYSKVNRDAVIAAEILVLGHRPLYQFQKLRKTFIQWRSSVIIMPYTKV